jgi:hypothetical protein
MNNTKDEAILDTLLNRFEKQRLPRLLDIKKKMQQGNILDKFEIEFLEEVLSDSNKNKQYFEDSDEKIKLVFMKIAFLYKDIINQAMTNEQQNKKV